VFTTTLLECPDHDDRAVLIRLGPDISEQVGGHFAHLDFLGAFRDAATAVVTVDVHERFAPRIANSAVHCMARSAWLDFLLDEIAQNVEIGREFRGQIKVHRASSGAVGPFPLSR
jgi:hypothetical protein